MTIITAAVKGDTAAIACDVAGTNVYSGTQAIHGTKLARFPFGVLGYTASYRTLQALHDELFKVQSVETEAEARRLVDVIDDGLQRAGWSRSSSKGLPTCEDLMLLVVSNGGRIWTVQSDLAVLTTRKYAAVGSGYQVALGAMDVGHVTLKSAADIARLGAKTAVKINAFCAGTVKVLSWNRHGEKKAPKKTGRKKG